MENKLDNFELTQRRNTVNLAIWTFAWVASVALVTFGGMFLWDDNTLLTSLAIIVNIGLGIGMIIANRRFLLDSDELMKKLHLEAMSLTLGLVLIFGIAYSLMDQRNIIPFDAEIGHLVIFMSLSYMASLFFLRSRYS
jgi:hypothetical protein